MFLAWLFLVGMCFGSFINMLVYRIAKNENIWGRSYCDITGNTLTWRDLIPIFSFIYYRGKCRECGNKLSSLYPIIEIFCGLLPIIIFTHLSTIYQIYSFDLIINLIVISLIGYSLIFFALYDYLFWEVDLTAIIFGIVVVIAILTVKQFVWQSLLLPELIPALAGGLTAALIISLIILFTKGAGMGDGDVFLFLLLGLLSGIDLLVIVFLLIVWSASIVGVIKAIYQHKLRGVLIQFAPFISLGGLIVLIYRSNLQDFLQNLFR